MPIRFSEESFFGAIVDASGRKFLSEFDSVLTKIRNPWDSSKVCVVADAADAVRVKAATATAMQSDMRFSLLSDG